jgi:hypothetical protein
MAITTSNSTNVKADLRGAGRKLCELETAVVISEFAMELTCGPFENPVTLSILSRE